MFGSSEAKGRIRSGRAPGWIAFPSPLLGLAVLAAASVPGAAPGLEAHEEAVLESPVSALPAGELLPLSGRDFGEGESYALRLLGALREYELGEVEAENDGTLSLELPLPETVEPGAYQLVAVAEDGDVVARLELQVLPARSAGVGTGSAAADGDGGPSASGSRARSDEIRIERDRSGLEWGAIGLLIGLAGGLGVGLLRGGGGATAG